MRYNDVIYLMRSTITQDDAANNIKDYVKRMVFTNQINVSSAAFYGAGNSGIRPDKEFEMHSFEYEGESMLEHNGLRYNVVRAHGAGDKLRLTCERVMGSG